MSLFKSDEEKKQEYLKKGLDYENKNENEKAIKEFQNILKLDPNDEDALFNLGFIYSDMKEYHKSYEYFKKLINNNPKHIEAFNNLGLLFARQGKYSDALLVYDKGIEFNPEAAVLYNNKGNVLYDMGRYEEALKNFKKAGELDPVFNERLYHLGIDSFIKGGGIDDAIKKLEESAQKNINHAKTSHDLGVAYLEKHMYDKAISAFNRALSIDPNYLSAYINMAYAYQHKEDYINAIKCLERAVILNPKSAKLYNTMGLLYDKLDKPEIAVKAYKKAVALDPAYANSHYMLGQLYQNRGNLEKAASEFAKHIKIHEKGPLVEDAMHRIAEIKSISFEEVKSIFAEHISQDTEIKKPNSTQSAPIPTEKRDTADYMKSIKEKMSAAQSAASANTSVSTPSSKVPKETKAMDAEEYMKKLKDKIKNKNSLSLPDTINLQKTPDISPDPSIISVDTVTSQSAGTIDLPSFSESVSESPAFSLPDDIPVVNLDEMPLPNNNSSNYSQENITKPSDFIGSVSSGASEYNQIKFGEDFSYKNEQNKINNDKNSDKTSGPSFKIKRNFY